MMSHGGSLDVQFIGIKSKEMLGWLKDNKFLNYTNLLINGPTINQKNHFLSFKLKSLFLAHFQVLGSQNVLHHSLQVFKLLQHGLQCAMCFQIY